MSTRVVHHVYFALAKLERAEFFLKNSAPAMVSMPSRTSLYERPRPLS